MEPLTNDTPAEEVDSAPDVGTDPDLAEAADALEKQLDGGSVGRAAGREAQPEATPPAPAPAKPDRWERSRTWQSENRKGYMQRFNETKRRAAELDAANRRYEEQLRGHSELMQKTLDYLRSQREPDEPTPPDALDPKFGEWLQAQIDKNQDARLKPVLDYIQAQQQQQQQAAQQQQAQQQQEELAGRITETFDSAARRYEQEQPELAHGWHDRLETMRTIFASRWERTGRSPEEALRMANAELFAVGHQAHVAGENPAAAIDAFICATAAAFGLEPEGPEDDVAAEAGNGNGYHAPAPPQTGETARLARVQNRARPAGSAGPKVASRVETHASELQELVRGGVEDVKKLLGAAMRDAHGNMAMAQRALAKVARDREMATR